MSDLALPTAPVSIFPVGQQHLELLLPQRMQGSSSHFTWFLSSIYAPQTEAGSPWSWLSPQLCWMSMFWWRFNCANLSTVNASQDLTNSVWSLMPSVMLSAPGAAKNWQNKYMGDATNAGRGVEAESPQHRRCLAGFLLPNTSEKYQRHKRHQRFWVVFFCQFTTSLSAPSMEPQLVSTQAWLRLHQGMKPAGLGEIKILTRE